MEKTTGLNFTEALEALRNNKLVKLPEWTGHWYTDSQTGQINVFTRTGDILLTPNFTHYNMREDWEIAQSGKGFDFAILALKAGKCVTRAGWNGKGMFIFQRPSDDLDVGFIVNTVKSLPQSVKDFYQNRKEGSPDRVNFTSYLCMKAADGTIVNGWLASQTDLLANDWGIFY